MYHHKHMYTGMCFQLLDNQTLHTKSSLHNSQSCHNIFPENKVKISLHEFHEIRHSVTSYFMKKDSKRCSDASTPESIHTKDESKRGSAFAFIFGVN